MHECTNAEEPSDEWRETPGLGVIGAFLHFCILALCVTLLHCAVFAALPLQIDVATVLSTRHTGTLLRLALGAIVLAVLTHTRADPDLFGHVRFGQDVFTAGSVQAADPYSFASDRAWINHEWLSEAVMYVAYAWGGNSGLVTLKLALLSAMIAAAFLILRQQDVPSSSIDLLLGLLIVTTFPQTNHVRPQLFSLALFAWLLAALIAARSKPYLSLWTIPLLAVWVDVHGGWIVGAGTLGLWTLIGLTRHQGLQHKIFSLAITASALMITLFNPYGWKMWTFLQATVGFGRADIIDWQPVFVLGPAYALLWTLTALAATVGIWSALRHQERDKFSRAPAKDWQSVAIVVFFAVASLRVSRLQSFFTIATVMLVGPSIAAAWQRAASRRVARVPSRLAAGFVAAIALAAIVGGVTVSAGNLGCIRMEDQLFPEPDVARLAAEQNLRGRMLTWFDWGEYAIWYFSPGVTVSMDGRRETVYSQEAINRHLTFYTSPDDRQAVLDALRPDYIWVPSRLEVTSRLVADGWQPLFAGPISTVLARAGTAAPPTKRASRPGAARCFPGP